MKRPNPLPPSQMTPAERRAEFCGLLALGLVLFVLRRLQPEGVWKDRPLSLAFWGMNIGLGLMIV